MESESQVMVAVVAVSGLDQETWMCRGDASAGKAEARMAAKSRAERNLVMASPRKGIDVTPPPYTTGACAGK